MSCVTRSRVATLMICNGCGAIDGLREVPPGTDPGRYQYTETEAAKAAHRTSVEMQGWKTVILTRYEDSVTMPVHFDICPACQAKAMGSFTGSQGEKKTNRKRSSSIRRRAKAR